MSQPVFSPEEIDRRICIVRYTNHRGETAWRTILPLTLWFGVSPFHAGEQWFLRAVDGDKGAERDFAVKGIHEWRQGNH